MSIKSELSKTVFNLRETRKAILGRGGDISPDAGLKDVPNAIWSIPADASLAFRVDSSAAYEKIVPVGAEEYANVINIGCLTRKNNNLCTFDGYYNLNGMESFHKEMQGLTPGEYYIKINGDFSAGEICVNGIMDTGSRELTFYVAEDGVCYVWIQNTMQFDEDGSEYYPSLSGAITGIMLCKADDPDKSYKPSATNNRNLCIADGHYDLGSRPHTEEGQKLELDLGVLTQGVYQFEIFGRIVNDAPINVDGLNVAFNETGASERALFGVTNTSEVTATLPSRASYDDYFDTSKLPAGTVDDYCWTGEITGIMLVKLSDTCNGIDDVLNTAPIMDLVYTPRFIPFVYTKPTSLESRGVNLFDIACSQDIPDDTAGAGTTKRKFKPYTCIIGMTRTNYYYPSNTSIVERTNNSFTITVNSANYGLAFALKLTPNTNYTVSYESTSDNSMVGYAFYDDDGTYLSNGAKTAKVLKFTTDNYGNVILLFTAPAGETATFSNIMLNRGTEALPYKPFSAEPIDTLALPENIEEECDGWGLGVDEEYNNHIVWRNGRIIYIQMLREFDLANVGEWKKAHNNFYTFPYVSPAMKDLDMKAYSSGTMPVGICSKYDMAMTSRVTGGQEDKVISYNKSDTYYINVRDTAYTDVATFTEAMKGVKLVYALETPIEKDVTHLFTDTSPFLKVQGGGGVIAHNEREQAVPSSLKYTVKVGI